MAGVDILCADKTGTLTKNDLSVAELVTFDKFTDSDLLMFATLASREEDNDHIDNAITFQEPKPQVSWINPSLTNSFLSNRLIQ